METSQKCVAWTLQWYVLIRKLYSQVVLRIAKHIFYEVAGTAGAFSSSSAISRFGNNYSFFLTPSAFFYPFKLVHHITSSPLSLLHPCWFHLVAHQHFKLQECRGNPGSRLGRSRRQEVQQLFQTNWTRCRWLRWIDLPWIHARVHKQAFHLWVYGLISVPNNVWILLAGLFPS